MSILDIPLFSRALAANRNLDDGGIIACDPPAHPVAEPGDLWVLGRHRLLCGNSTVATDVARVLGGVAPHLMVTDPPYGVNYDPSWRNQAGRSTMGRPGGLRPAPSPSRSGRGRSA